MRAVVAGGRGQVGQLLVRLFADAGAQVRTIDAAAGEDILAPDDSVAEADLVALALPEPVALAAVPVTLAHMRPDALLVETLSVKTHVAAAIAAHRSDQEALGINPMFAPSLGIPGRPVALVPHAPGPRGAAFEALLAAAGASLVTMSAAEHDGYTAALQAATHAAVLAFGLALNAGEVDIATLRRLAPPPHETLLLLLARIAGGAPEVYWDIQAGNPQAAAARAAVGDGLARLCTLAQRDDFAGFAAALTELNAFLGEERSDLTGRCARLFARLPSL